MNAESQIEATYFRMKGLTVLIEKKLNKSYSVLIETCDVNLHLVPYVNDSLTKDTKFDRFALIENQQILLKFHGRDKIYFFQQWTDLVLFIMF